MTHITQRQRWARLAAWAVSLAATITGIFLVSIGKTAVWVNDPSAPDTYLSQTVQVGLIGIAVLTVGLLSVMAVLIAEGYATGRNNKSIAQPPVNELGSSTFAP